MSNLFENFIENVYHKEFISSLCFCHSDVIKIKHRRKFQFSRMLNSPALSNSLRRGQFNKRVFARTIKQKLEVKMLRANCAEHFKHLVSFRQNAEDE